jgi:ribose/xylose/arabinose/galactoside ABC-type transport system permease subunit
MVTLKSGGTQLGWPNWLQEIITGGIILVSVALDKLRTLKASRA